MPWPNLPGPAFWSIVITAVLLLTATIVGYLHGESWDTLSDMITRNNRLRNAFALMVGIMVMCQGFYTLRMYKRWANRAALHGDEPSYALSIAVTVGYLLSFGGSVGFAIVSTDIAQGEHVTYAAIAFAGIYMYLLAFEAMEVYYGGALWPRLSAFFLVVPVVALGVYAVCHWAGEPISRDYDYVWEYIFIVCMVGAACSLFVKKSDKAVPTAYAAVHTETRLSRRCVVRDLVF